MTVETPVVGRIRKPQLDSLTTLRGFGALWVVACHMAVSLPRFEHHITYFFLHGWLAVDFFFILSGFVISYSYLDLFSERIEAKKARKFLTTRFLRIYPLAFLVLVCVWLPCFAALKILGLEVDPEIFSGRSFFLQLFLLNGIGLPDSKAGWNGPTWALSSEFVLYCCFPFLAYCTAKLKGGALNAALMAILVGGLVLLSILITHGSQFMLGDGFVLVRTGSEFILGCLLFNLYASSPPKRFFIEASGWVCIGLVLVLSVIGLHPFYHFLYLLLFLFIIYALSNPTGASKRLLENKVLVRLGQLSFSIYIIHYFILSINRRLVKMFFPADTVLVDIGFFTVSLILILAASVYLYRLEESIKTFFNKRLRN